MEKKHEHLLLKYNELKEKSEVKKQQNLYIILFCFKKDSKYRIK